jgi:transposase-like protein
MSTEQIKTPAHSPENVPPTEVSSKPQRRRFTNEFKLRILREADACKKPGEIGSLLRREGLYSSHLVDWRTAREKGELAGESRPRGPKPVETDPRVAELERENALLVRRADRAEALVALQKKVAEILGSPLLDLGVMP